MGTRKKDELAAYACTRLGFETVYTGETALPDGAQSDTHLTYGQDEEGNVHITYSCWGFSHLTEEDWNDEIRHINALQEQLGDLDDGTRRIRAQIASLQGCDSGVPVTIDEILNAIGTGRLPEPAFHPGCWLSMGTRGTQPGQTECMQTIEKVLRAYLGRARQEELIAEHPFAEGFIRRTYAWLGPVEALSDTQRLMMDRLLLPFEFLAKRTEDHQVVNANCVEPGGQGEAIDKLISEVAGLPEIHANYRRGFRENLKSIDDPHKRETYIACCAMAHGLHGLSDCHHSTFRWIEGWLYGIGRFSLQVQGREAGTEAKRLGRLLFGYALGLDRWLQGVPMQWLLLDLGHIDPGFDAKNEILRVYAYLGERSPVKEWLAACLWYTLVLERPASLYDWGHRHRELVEAAGAKGICVQDWMDARLGREARDG
jgi:hypothetical protein